MNADNLAPLSDFSLFWLVSSNDNSVLISDAAVAATSAEVGIKTYILCAALRFPRLGSDNRTVQNRLVQTCLLGFLDLDACEYFPQDIGSFLHRFRQNVKRIHIVKLAKLLGSRL